MRFLSVCSGIEAASVAWEPLGWKAVAFSEIEPFPCAVLAHHYPDTPNWGDMTKFEDWPNEPIDLLCGGTPCQSFSVAGLRKGLADPRGNLMLTFGAIAAKYRPEWLVWENVPGVLSSNGGRDFGAFLGMLGQLGYGFAYRVLDAQYFGVAQRRRRVFVVARLGDWRAPAAVLFERHSLSGHPAPSREARQVIAPTIRAGAANGGPGHGARIGDSRDELIVPVETLCVATGQAGAEIGAEIGADMAPTLNCNHEAPYVAHTLRGEGFDASEDGPGRGTPLVPVLSGTIEAASGRSRGAGISPGLLLPFDTTQVTSVANRSNPKPGDPCHPLAAGAHAPAIAFPANLSATQHASTEELSPSLGALNPTAVAVRDISQTITSNYGKQVDSSDTALGPNVVYPTMQVRRLTPTECERLQGFPDGYTDIPWTEYQRIQKRADRAGTSFEAELRKHGKVLRGPTISACPDGPRYKALGNSWAVPNVRWIGGRIEQVKALESLKVAA